MVQAKRSMIMKKFFISKVTMLAMMMVAALCFTACGGDDDEDEGSLLDGNGSIEINGKKWPLSIVTLEGSWGDYHSTGGNFTVSTQNGSYVDYYRFEFELGHQPEVGDELANHDLTLVPAVEDDDDPYHAHLYEYDGGSAKVVGTDKAEGEITIKFSKLKMSYGSKSYTFNGTATLLFRFR